MIKYVRRSEFHVDFVGLVDLVCLVYFVYFVDLVCFVDLVYLVDLVGFVDLVDKQRERLNARNARNDRGVKGSFLPPNCLNEVSEHAG